MPTSSCAHIQKRTWQIYGHLLLLLDMHASEALPNWRGEQTVYKHISCMRDIRVTVQAAESIVCEPFVWLSLWLAEVLRQTYKCLWRGFGSVKYVEPAPTWLRACVHLYRTVPEQFLEPLQRTVAPVYTQCPIGTYCITWHNSACACRRLWHLPLYFPVGHHFRV